MSDSPDDPKADAIMFALLNQAMDLVRDALDAGKKNDAFWLARGNDGDTKATAGALLSAWHSFVRRTKIDESMIDDLNLEDLAAIYVRVTYNRLRRKTYQDQKISDQLAQGTKRGNDGEFLPFDPADPKIQADVLKNLPDEIAMEVGKRSERDRLVIALWVESKATGNKLTLDEIAKEVTTRLDLKPPLSLVGVHRIIDRFKDDMRRRLSEQ